ncbi:M1 family metallopeptidase [Pseudoduganella ginsengisoli]|uniref:Aminopeptidase n=1 Tax=Pseudoduganella ginsengisoli TaxID=1462440 RepID=A0A6L6PUQ3_9BURK|nr:M1 family metallopeptidase [Pseudoduganella ginsengisoli]MTW01217.1 M1 family peptidase [Pseudoduganella ginsengisoli]
MQRTLLSALIALACAAPLDFSYAAASPALATTQLPRDTRPLHYDLSLTPDAQHLSFTGKVDIDFEVLAPAGAITLQAADLDIASATLRTPDGKTLDAAIKLDAAEQTVRLQFPRKLAKGTYRLAMAYSGKIGTQPSGMFAVDYETAEGKKRALYTQFENADARRVMPSWDEPAYKATFTVSATIPSGEMAVSNMPAEQTTEIGGGKSLVRFQRTPKMSTYLLFFALGDFERVSTMADGTDVGIITKKGSTAHAGFALDAAKSVLREYNDYFGIRYPLPKLDNIAAPGSSQYFEAMENWGAILTFEYSLLVDPAFTTQASQERSFQTNAHEVAHQWFGNLVTMGWWDDLWLNEGFASWLDGRTTDRLHPDWNYRLGSIAKRDLAMGQDALSTTHPVVAHIARVQDASQAFDNISYEKGKALVDMLEAYVGETAWRDGVRAYMRKHSYGNTRSDDLWAAVESVTHKPIKAIAHDFTLQPGVPMITAGEPVCAAGRTTVELTQGEFSKDAPNKQPLRWRVPVLVQVLGQKEGQRVVVENGKAKVTMPGCGPVVVNAGQAGYFRTAYSDGNFAALAGQFSQLNTIDQLGLLSDSWAMGLAGQRPLSNFLGLSRMVPADADPQVWGKVVASLAGINGLLDGEPERQANFARYALSQLKPLMARVGWEAKAGEAPTVATLRNDLINTLSYLNDPETIAEARRRFAAQASDPSAVPAPLRKTILSSVAYHADSATWEQLHTMAQSEKSTVVRDYLYRMLGMAKDAGLARRALELALSSEPGATNSAPIMSAVAGRHPDMAFDFASANLEQVRKLVDADATAIFLPRLAGGSHDASILGKLDTLAQTHIPEGSRMTLNATIAQVKNTIRMRKERMPAVDTWLAKHAS